MLVILDVIKSMMKIMVDIKRCSTSCITTEQETEEVQTMMLAFLSNVPEDNILNGRYQGDEEKELEAAQILKK